MTNEISPSDAILKLLRDMNATPDQPIVLFEIGIPMVVEQRFTESEVLDGLKWLQSEGVIKLMEGNRLRVVNAMSDSAVQDITESHREL